MGWLGGLFYIYGFFMTVQADGRRGVGRSGAEIGTAEAVGVHPADVRESILQCHSMRQCDGPDTGIEKP